MSIACQQFSSYYAEGDDMWIADLAILLVLVLFFVAVWARQESRQKVTEPFTGWFLYFDSRHYLHPRINLPVAKFGSLLDPKLIRVPHKKGSMLTSKEINKLLRDPTIKRFVERYSANKVSFF